MLTLLLGLAAIRLVHNSKDFLSAGRKLPFLLNSFALFAFWFGSETVFGASSEFIRHGLLGVIEDPFGGFLCLLLFGLLFVRPLYRKNIITLGDLFRERYGAKVEFVASFFMLLSFFGYIAAQLIALSILFESVFGLSSTSGIIFSSVIVTAYTAGGGMWAISITDFIQSIVIVLGLILLAIYLTGLAGPGSVFVAPKENFFQFYPTTGRASDWFEYLAAWLTLGFGSLASQDIFQRANAAKSEKTAVRSTYFGAFLYLIIALLPLYLGLLVYQIHPAFAQGDTQYSLMSLVSNYAPLWLQVLFYGALISAIFSTCSGALLAPSTILSENMIKPLFFPQASDRQFLIISRLSVVLIAVAATLLAMGSDSIYGLVAESSILGLVAILVPMYSALFHNTTSRWGAILSMGLGLGSYLAFEYLFPIPFPAMLIGFGSSIAGMALGRAIKK
ncbi:MAG: sodium:solute symporter family protein [Cyclobacteriaceae bacterium]|nr:sodium:solute symporter family protein [Cyclobacteriaceae bacterium]